MVRYILQRLGQGLITIFLITIAVFALSRFTGDAALVLLPITADREVIAEYRHRLGLDKPAHVQYALFIKNAVQGDLGDSIRTRQPVISMIGVALPNTLRLAVAEVVPLLFLALPLGIAAALFRGKLIDKMVRVIAVFGMAMPHFWFAILLILLFCTTLKWLPPVMDPARGPVSYILPVIAGVGVAVAGIMRLTRSSMLEIQSAEFIKYARAKGISEKLIVLKHVVRNALIPVLTLAGIYFVLCIAGSVVIENIFSWPGIGLLAYSALMARDMPVLQGAILTVAMVVVAGNLIIDISYGLIDPRARVVRIG